MKNGGISFTSFLEWKPKEANMKSSKVHMKKRAQKRGSLTKQTEKDHRLSEERAKACGDDFYRTAARLDSEFPGPNGKATRDTMLPFVQKEIANRQNSPNALPKLDRLAKRGREALICYFCENGLLIQPPPPAAQAPVQLDRLDDLLDDDFTLDSDTDGEFAFQVFDYLIETGATQRPKENPDDSNVP
jgi:hypothetical protein